jgi:hypothetical protein
MGICRMEGETITSEGFVPDKDQAASGFAIANETGIP